MNLHKTKEQWATLLSNSQKEYHFGLDALTVVAFEDLATLFAENERLNLRVAELESEALRAEEKGWRDALSCLKYCEANWYQDCKSDVERQVLRRATTDLVAELIDASPSEWLGTEWLTAEDWIVQLWARNQRITELEALLDEIEATEPVIGGEP